jgi:glycosyltransferase involved in cell wall biosynthesis
MPARRLIHFNPVVIRDDCTDCCCHTGLLVRPIRVVSIVEAWFVTGQAKNLLEFAQRSRVETAGVRSVNLSLVTYERGAGEGEKNKFVTGAREARVALDLITEKGRFDTSVLPQLRRIIEQSDPDIIQTHNVKSHFLMRLSGLWKTRKWLAFHHGYTATDFKMRCYNQLDRWSLRAASGVVTVCGAFARDLEEKGIAAGRITVRHNSVKPFSAPDPAAVEALRAQFPPETPILLVVGRLSHEKGQADFLAALDILRRKSNLPFHAVLVGEGPEEERLKALRVKLGLESAVTMAGLQHDVRPWYAAASVVVMPSHSEGSPNVLLESMAAGVPVVATRVGGVPEIATNEETALLTEPRNPEALADAIARMLSDGSLRESIVRNAKKLAEEQYSPEAYRRSLVAIYEKVIAA